VVVRGASGTYGTGPLTLGTDSLFQYQFVSLETKQQ